MFRAFLDFECQAINTSRLDKKKTKANTIRQKHKTTHSKCDGIIFPAIKIFVSNSTPLCSLAPNSRAPHFDVVPKILYYMNIRGECVVVLLSCDTNHVRGTQDMRSLKLSLFLWSSFQMIIEVEQKFIFCMCVCVW